MIVASDSCRKMKTRGGKFYELAMFTQCFLLIEIFLWMIWVIETRQMSNESLEINDTTSIWLLMTHWHGGFVLQPRDQIQVNWLMVITSGLSAVQCRNRCAAVLLAIDGLRVWRLRAV